MLNTTKNMYLPIDYMAFALSGRTYSHLLIRGVASDYMLIGPSGRLQNTTKFLLVSNSLNINKFAINKQNNNTLTQKGQKQTIQINEPKIIYNK